MPVAGLAVPRAAAVLVPRILVRHFPFGIRFGLVNLLGTHVIVQRSEEVPMLDFLLALSLLCLTRAPARFRFALKHLLQQRVEQRVARHRIIMDSERRKGSPKFPLVDGAVLILVPLFEKLDCGGMARAPLSTLENAGRMTRERRPESRGGWVHRGECPGPPAAHAPRTRRLPPGSAAF